MTQFLRFSPLKNNTKLKWMGEGTYSFSTLAGWSCPGACDCLSRAIETPEGRRIQDGPNTKFRCYSASQEILFKKTYEQRKHNMELLMSVANSKELTVQLIQNSLPKDARIIRLFCSGDFANQRIFDSFLEVARKNSQVLFYAYTKSLVFWVRRLGEIPENLVLTGSKGGRYDNLIDEHKLRYCVVVHNDSQARKLGLKVDRTDKYAMLPRYRDMNFALCLHGPQKRGTVAARVWKKQIDGKAKFHGYSSNKPAFGRYYKEQNHVKAI